MFQASQPVSIHDPTHFWQIKSGVLLARDPEHPGFWEVSTDFGKRWFHESEMTPAAPPKPARRRPKGLPRTILVPTAVALAGPDTVGPGTVELYD